MLNTKKSKLYQVIKDLLYLLILSKKSIIKLSKEDYLVQTILLFIIVYIVWSIVSILYFKENISNATLHSILEGIILGPLSPLLFAIIFYGINLLFKTMPTFKNILQLTTSMEIIVNVFFTPIWFLSFLVLPTNEITIWLGRVVGITQIIWEFYVLKYFGEVITINNKKKSTIISIITLSLYAIINIPMKWYV